MRGLEGVGVVVENLNPEAEQDGLYRNRLQTYIELRLRKAGIRVLTKEEQSNLPSSPYLYINVNAMKTTELGAYVFSTTVSLSEWVRLVRKPFLLVSATTWRTPEGVGIVKAFRLEEFVFKQVGAMVDEFINDYLAANPQPETVKPQPFKKD
ncbi:MAG: hypothetical protein KAV99_07765 [Candidatus Latescibacteria bacterium]|nr:hypothetical protein [Candidatus Latescibacterota bacterium]